MEEIFFKTKELNCILRKNSKTGFLNYISRQVIFTEKKSVFLPNDTLTLKCRIWKSKGEFLLVEEFFCKTKLHTENFLFYWTISNFSTLTTGQRVQFPVTPLSESSPSMFMDIFLTGEPSDKETIQIEIVTTDTNKVKTISCKLNVLDMNGTVLIYVNDHTCFHHRYANQKWMLPFSLPKRKLTVDKTRYLPNDTLKLKCELSMGIAKTRIECIKGSSAYGMGPSKKTILVHKTIHEGKSSIVSSSMKEALKSMYLEGLFSDMKLETSSETFPVHKIILSARSAVFKTMFSDGMRRECVNIPDVDSDTMGRMLWFMYSDTLEDLHWDDTSKLYVAAEKYEVMDLKDKCSSVLKEKLSPSNACDILVLANIHHDDGLKTSVQNWISSCGEKIITSDAWENLQRNHSVLAAETLRSVYLMKKDI